MNKDTYKYF